MGQHATTTAEKVIVGGQTHVHHLGDGMENKKFFKKAAQENAMKNTPLPKPPLPKKRARSTSANFNFGQLLDVEFDQKGWGPKVGGPRISLFFFPLPSLCSFSPPSLVGPFVEFWWCLKTGTLKCARLEFSGCHVKPRRSRSQRAQTCTQCVFGLCRSDPLVVSGSRRLGQNRRHQKPITRAFIPPR